MVGWGELTWFGNAGATEGNGQPIMIATFLAAWALVAWTGVTWAEQPAETVKLRPVIEGEWWQLTDRDWKPQGITFTGDGTVGERVGAMQAPHVIRVDDQYRMYYAPGRQQTSVYRSVDPTYFGIDDDSNFVGRLPVAAPELIRHEGRWYIAALNAELDGIRIARLNWVAGDRTEE